MPADPLDGYLCPNCHHLDCICGNNDADNNLVLTNRDKILSPPLFHDWGLEEWFGCLIWIGILAFIGYGIIAMCRIL